MAKSTITLDSETIKKLEKFKKHPRQSYEEIVIMLIQYKKEAKLK